MRNCFYALLLLLAACGPKRQSPTEAAATRLCNCYSSKTVGTVEDRLTPCFQRVITEKQKELESATSDQAFFHGQLEAYGLELMVGLTRSCDTYFDEVSALYDAGYPLDTSAFNRNEIERLSKKIEGESNRDSVKAALHKKVKRLLQLREYKQALDDIQRIELLDSADYQALLARAFVFSQAGMFEDAVKEIEKAVAISGNPNMILYAEIARGKSRRTKGN